jgi:CRISPR-associated protein Csb2
MPMNVISRNYKPSEAERKAGKFQGDPSIVFDTFVSVSRRDRLFIGWLDAELSADDHSMLAKLLANLSSLGRAEGWVHADLTNEQPSWNCTPAPGSDPNPVPVFCPDPVTAFGDEHYPKFDPNKLAKGKVNPSDFLFDCPRWHLCLDTETLHDKKWPTVPGSRWVSYTRPTETTARPGNWRPIHRPKPTTARFALDSPVLPLLTETLPLAEAARRHLMGRYRRVCQKQKYGRNIPPDAETFVSHVFSGKDATGQPLTGHQHAYYLPTDEDGDGRIDHLTVYAEKGFDAEEVAALDRLRWLPWGDREPLRLLLVGLGAKRDFRAPLLDESPVWLSATPFVVTRYPKRRGTKRDRPEDYATPEAFTRHVLHQELVRRNLPEVLSIEPKEFTGAHHLRSIQFKRFRSKRGDDGGRRPAGLFCITFAAPVRGPLCLGHACHFGLGLFVPSSPSAPRAAT